MTTKTFISELWDSEATISSSGVGMSQVNAAIATATADLLKLDGTRSMKASLNLDSNPLEKVTSIKPPTSGDNIEVDGSLNMRNFNLNNIQGLNAVPGGSLKFNSNVEFGGTTIDLQDGEIINTKEPQSDNALATVKSVRKQEVIIDSMFEKVLTSKLPVSGQICTASSSYTGVKNILPDNVFDGKLTTEWITNTANSLSWLQIELPTAIHIWKVKFCPRLGAQEKTHIFTSYVFKGSFDGVTYDTLLKHSIYPIDQNREFEIGVTKPYKFFKFEGTGNAHFGLSQIYIYEATKVDKQYVDTNTAFVSGGGITRGTGGLELEVDVLRLTSPAILPTSNVSDNFPLFVRMDIPTNKLYFSNSYFTIPKTTTIGATKPTDLVSKQYVDDNCVAIGLYTVDKSLPGVPVSNGMTMMFVPSLRTCTINANYEVSAIEDPLTGLKLTGTNLPLFKFDSDKLYYMEFNGTNDILFADNIQISTVGGVNGNTTTFFLIADTKTVKQQFQFSWTEKTATIFNNGNRFSVHLPWSNEIIYLDYGKLPNGAMGRVEKSYVGQSTQLVSRKVMYTYRIDGTNVKVFLNGTQIISQALNAALSTGVSGRFTLGGDANLSRHCTMDFYGLYFYNRALTDTEIAAMHLYLRVKYNII